MKRIFNIIGLILFGILFYIILTVPDTPMLLAPLGGMVIGWVAAWTIFNWG